MKNLLILIILILLLLLQPVSSFADKITFSERAGFDSRYPDNNVYVMFKDSKDIIWFGTMFGLIMYDGNNYTKFRYNPEDSNSISNDDVISICEDSKGYLWFGTFYGGLNRYDRKTGLFKRFLSEDKTIPHNTVWSICEDKKGVIWAGTEQGLSKYENNLWSSVRYGDDSVSMRINCLAVDDFDNLFIGTFGSGLIICDAERKNFRKFGSRDSSENNLRGLYVRCLYSFKGDTYIGMINRGAYLLKSGDISAGRFRFTNIIPEKDITGNYKWLTVFDIRKSGNDKIIAGTNNGLFLYNPADNSSELIYSDAENKADNNFLSVLPVGNNFIFASNYNKALFRLYFNKINSTEKYYYDSKGNPAGNIKSIVRSGGLTLAAGKNGLFEVSDSGLIKSDINNLLNSKNIISAVTDNSYNLYIGTPSGLLKVSSDFKKTDTLLTGNFINSLVIKDDSLLIAGTSNGIKIISISSFKKIREFIHNPSDNASVSDNFILSLFADSKGNLWAGTYAGLNLLKPDSDKFIRYRKKINDSNSLINNYVYCYYETEGKIYFGTGGGLSIFDGEKFVNITNREGLDDQSVYSILKHKGKLWISTNFNITIFDPAADTFSEVKNFNEQFNQSAAFEDTRGVLIYGNNDGIVKVKTEEITESKNEANFIFTSLTYETGNDLIQIDLTSTPEVNLPFDAVNIKLGYSDLNFQNPGTSRYYYSISNIDKEWSYNGSSTQLNIKRLDPGHYEVKFKIAGNNGNSYESPVMLSISVTPPFYNTILFYALVTSIILLIIYSSYKYRIRIKIRRALEFERMKEREREKIRYETSRDYHDELGHKLTRISIYSRNLLKEIEEHKENISKELNKIIETSKSLRESAGDLIWSMDPGEDTLMDLTIRIKDFTENLLQDTNISLSISGISENFKSRHLSMDEKRNILLITKEAVNNSVKYSESDRINIMFGLTGNTFTLKISDNGIGFDIKDSKDGYGLKSMTSRAERIKAGISIVSNQGIGTAVSIELKLKDILKEISLN